MKKSTKGEETKNKIIECAAKLFDKKGYNSTGIKEILEICSLPKGSFYFHFSSKKELALEVGNYYEKEITQWIENALNKNNDQNFIENFIDILIEKAEKEEYYGCPITTVAQELSFFEPEIAKHYNELLQKRIRIFYMILIKQGKSEEQARETAQNIFVIYEGHIVYFRISKNINLLKHMKKQLSEFFK